MNAFTPKTWANDASGSTPITAAELNRMEAGIESADTRLDELPGRYAVRGIERAFNFGLRPRHEDFSKVPAGTPLSVYGKTTSGAPYQYFLFRDNTNASNPTPSASDSVVDYRADGTPEHRLKVSGADYFWTTAAHEIDEAVMLFSHRALPGVSNGTTNSGVCLAISKKTGAAAVNTDGVFSNSIHIGFGPSYFRATIGRDTQTPILQGFEGGDVLVNNLSLPTDGTILPLYVRRTGRDRIRFVIPGHLDIEGRDSRIPDVWGSTVGHEHLRYDATFGTDAEPLIHEVIPGPPVARGRRSTAQGATLAGIPGGAPSSAPTAAPFASNITVYFPMDIENPITLNKLSMEVAAAYPAGAVASWAILAADAAWQPKALLHDLGVSPVLDTVGIKTMSNLNRQIEARRALLGLRVSTWASGATLRTFPYTMSSFSQVRESTLGTGAFIPYVTVSEAFSTNWATPTPWNSMSSSAVPGILCPAVFSWTEN